MSICRFGTFQFDRDRLRLFNDGKPVALRPKAALVLAVLVENSGKTVTKSALISEVWHGRPIQDQTLFQTMSELRRVLGSERIIVTIPNLGYRCVLPEPPPCAAVQNKHAYQRIATFAAAVVLALLPGSMPPADKPQTIHAAPAIQAFALGMRNLHAPAKARRYFELATQENGSFLEAQLMLSETLYSEGQYERAHEIAETLLIKARISKQNYVQASVMDLLSRMSASAGAQTRALNWARKARDAAADGAHACTSELAERRIFDLDPTESFPSSPISPMAPGLAGTGHRADSGVTAENYAENSSRSHCDELLPSPNERKKLSQCDIGNPSFMHLQSERRRALQIA